MHTKRMRGRTSGTVKDQLGGRLLNVNLADSIQVIRLTSLQNFIWTVLRKAPQEAILS